MPFGLAATKRAVEAAAAAAGMPRPDQAAAGQGRPRFRHGRRALDTGCLIAADRRCQDAGRPAGGHSRRCRARSLYRARASRHTRGPDRRSGRRAVVTAHKLRITGSHVTMIVRFIAHTVGAAAIAFLALIPSAQAQQQPSAAAIALATQLLEIKGGIAAYDPAIDGVVIHHKGQLLQINPNLGKDINDVERDRAQGGRGASGRTAQGDRDGLCQRVQRAGSQGHDHLLQDAARQEDDRAGAEGRRGIDQARASLDR